MDFGSRLFRRLGRNPFVDREIAFTAALLRGSPTRIEVRADDDDERNFFRAVGNFFQAPQVEINEVRLLCREAIETPVVFHISRHARIASEEVAREHLAGRSWSALLLEHHVHPETFHVALAPEPPASVTRPYRSYRRGTCEAWKSRTFTDEDVVNLANLLVASVCYDVEPGHVIALRMAGWSFPRIHTALQTAGPLGSVWERRVGFGAPADSNRRAVAGAPRG